MDVPPGNTSPAVIYARVSTDEQREGQTIDSQIEELRRFADLKGWSLHEIYKDEGWSGSILGRPDLDRLRDDASRGLFKIVLVNDVDRLARDVTHLGVIKRDLLRHGVVLVFRKLPNDNSPTNNLLVNILGSFAEFERELIADRTRRGRRYKVETRQRFLGSIAPYGYRYLLRRHTADGEGLLEIVPSEAAVVRKMYRWIDQQGLSARQVVMRLNERGLSPRRRGRIWQKSSVLRILRSEVYAGVWHYNKHELQHHNELTDRPGSRPRSTLRRRPREAWIPVLLSEGLRIIERAQWERVQRQLDANIAFSPRHSKHNYLLRGLIRCGGCGSAYVGDPDHGKFSYRCWARCRRLPVIREQLLNDIVWNSVLGIVLNPTLVKTRLASLLARYTPPDDAQHNDTSQHEAALDRLAAEEERMITAYRTGVVSIQVLTQELENMKRQRTRLEQDRITAASRGPNHDSVVIESVSDFLARAAARIAEHEDGERQHFLRLVLRSIRIEPGRIRIIGRLPTQADLPDTDSSAHSSPTSTATASDDELPNVESLACRIATTEADHNGRNVAVEFELTASLDFTRPQQSRDEETRRFAA